MPLEELGYELALDQLTDATNGINYISIFTDIVEVTKQAITFASASGNEFGASVAANNLPLTFSITAGHTVQAIGLYHGITKVGYIEVTEVTDANAFNYVVDTLTINVS